MKTQAEHHLHTEEHLGLPGAECAPLPSPQKEPTLPKARSWISSLQNHGTINFCHLNTQTNRQTKNPKLALTGLILKIQGL